MSLPWPQLTREEWTRRLAEMAALRSAGGPGSGNFGHAGRPGEVGGSSDEPQVVVNGEPIGLAAEARKAGSFEEFQHDYLSQIKHGIYWHVTRDPNFVIDMAKGPRDMSSMADGSMDAGALMITSHLENWVDHYNDNENDPEHKHARPYAALIDMSEVPRKDYRQVSRGFGNEFYLADTSKVKVLGVVPVAKALKMDEKHSKALPQNEEELRAFYNKAISK